MARILLVEAARALAPQILVPLLRRGIELDIARDRRGAIAALRRRECGLIVIDAALPRGEVFLLRDDLARDPDLAFLPRVFVDGPHCPAASRRLAVSGEDRIPAGSDPVRLAAVLADRLALPLPGRP